MVARDALVKCTALCLARPWVFFSNLFFNDLQEQIILSLAGIARQLLVIVQICQGT